MVTAKNKRILIIQTAFIGDVILATALIEKLHRHFPYASIDFLLRKGNESLLEGHPYLRSVLVFDKKQNKYKNLWRLVDHIRRQKYDEVVNVQRFLTTGLITAFSGAKRTIGFDKNPLAFSFSHKVAHNIDRENSVHEIVRNQQLIAAMTDEHPSKPKLYPLAPHFEKVSGHKRKPYVCIAPTSVWRTKQLPAKKWIELILQLPKGLQVFLLGAPTDIKACETIREQCCKVNRALEVHVLAGKLNLLESAALMQGARMNYVNDSAPMHLCSAMNAPTCAIFCSTVPEFGFGPLSENALVIESEEKLHCRPCGLHGHKVCPEGHFKCAEGISITTLSKVIKT